MPTDDPRGDDVYQPDAPDDGEVPDYEGIRDSEDTLVDRGADPYDEGVSPPERPLAVERAGTTPREQYEGETLDQRLAEEEPDPTLSATLAADDNGIGDLPGGSGEPRDEEVGDHRAGRLVAPDEGTRADEEKDLLADDVGIAGAAASAEEAAVHIVPDPEEFPEIVWAREPPHAPGEEQEDPHPKR